MSRSRGDASRSGPSSQNIGVIKFLSFLRAACLPSVPPSRLAPPALLPPFSLRPVPNWGHVRIMVVIQVVKDSALNST